MKDIHMTDSAEEVFEHYLPARKSGYVRSLRLAEAQKIGVREGYFGFFYASGEFKYWADDEIEFYQMLEERRLQVHKVH